MYSLWQDLFVDNKIFDFVTFDLLLKTHNLGHNFWTKRDRAFIFHMCISCGKTFLSIPKFLTKWPWPSLLTYFWKRSMLAITFELKEIELSYFTSVFLVARPIFWEHFFTSWPWPWLLTYFWKKLNLDHNFWTKSDRALILHISIPCGKTFLLIPILLT